MGWAVITGASSGIGKSLAFEMASQGYDLILIARRLGRLKEIAQNIQLKFAAVKIEVMECDLTDIPSRTRCLQLLEELNRQKLISVLINNAGLGSYEKFSNSSESTNASMLSLNIEALVELCRWGAKIMQQSKSGTIVNVASLGGFSPVPYFAVYAATKAFVISFSEAIAEELRATGIRVLCICPGVTTTEFGDVAKFNKDATLMSSQTPEQVANETGAAIKAMRSGVIITGSKNRFAKRLQYFLPRKWTTRLTAKLIAISENSE